MMMPPADFSSASSTRPSTGVTAKSISSEAASIFVSTFQLKKLTLAFRATNCRQLGRISTNMVFRHRCGGQLGEWHDDFFKSDQVRPLQHPRRRKISLQRCVRAIAGNWTVFADSPRADLNETFISLPVAARGFNQETRTGPIILTYYRPTGPGLSQPSS